MTPGGLRTLLPLRPANRASTATLVALSDQPTTPQPSALGPTEDRPSVDGPRSAALGQRPSVSGPRSDRGPALGRRPSVGPAALPWPSALCRASVGSVCLALGRSGWPSTSLALGRPWVRPSIVGPRSHHGARSVWFEGPSLYSALGVPSALDPGHGPRSRHGPRSGRSLGPRHHHHHGTDPLKPSGLRTVLALGSADRASITTLGARYPTSRSRHSPLPSVRPRAGPQSTALGRATALGPDLGRTTALGRRPSVGPAALPWPSVGFGPRPRSTAPDRTRPSHHGPRSIRLDGPSVCPALGVSSPALGRRPSVGSVGAWTHGPATTTGPTR